MALQPSDEGAFGERLLAEVQHHGGLVERLRGCVALQQFGTGSGNRQRRRLPGFGGDIPNGIRFATWSDVKSMRTDQSVALRSA